MTNPAPPQLILGIDTSCDDTGVGVVALHPSGRAEVRANRIWSQTVHASYGGVMPELASREHVERIDAVMEDALKEAGVNVAEIGAVAATSGPGLMGALLVGLMYGKGLAQGLGVPFYAAHHLEGHIFAAASEADLPPPYLALVVSGGHTHLFDVVGAGQYRLIGATRDDAAGEAFDKVARLANLGYPGGPAIAEAARRGNPRGVTFKEPMLGQSGYDFSFSGLKTAALLAHRAGASGEDLAASFQAVAVKHLLKVTRAGRPRPGPPDGGGVGRGGGQQRVAGSVWRVRSADRFSRPGPQHRQRGDDRAGRGGGDPFRPRAERSGRRRGGLCTAGECERLNDRGHPRG